MPFPMKIQPLDVDSELPAREPVVRPDSAKPVLKSRFRRLFDRQLPSVLRISSAADKAIAVGDPAQFKENGATEFEPSSVCLDKMVQSFIEDTNAETRQPPPPPPTAAVKCGRNRCNCFNANSNDSSDDEFDVFGGFAESLSSGSFGGDASDVLKALIPCASVTERNLLADTSKIVEKNKIHKRKDDLIKVVSENLSTLGYESSICKSKWEKSPSFPAGEYEYIDVITNGERLLIDIDFRSEFEIARSTGAYKAILQSLPYIFVGKSDRLGQIVSIVSEAAKQSLKKKGMHFPPWRKAEYMRAKWLSAHARASPPSEVETPEDRSPGEDSDQESVGELELIFGEKSLSPPEKEEAVTWQLPELKPKSVDRAARMVTGLASLLKEKS